MTNGSSSRLFATSAVLGMMPQANHNEEEGDGSGGTQQQPEHSFTLYARGLRWGGIQRLRNVLACAILRLCKALAQSQDRVRLATQS